MQQESENYARARLGSQFREVYRDTEEEPDEWSENLDAMFDAALEDDA